MLLKSTYNNQNNLFKANTINTDFKFSKGSYLASNLSLNFKKFEIYNSNNEKKEENEIKLT